MIDFKNARWKHEINLEASQDNEKSHCTGCFAESKNSTVTKLRVIKARNRGSIPGQGQEVFHFSNASGQAMGSNQPPIQCIPRVSDRGVHLEPSLRLGGETLPLPIRLHGVQGQLYFCLTLGDRNQQSNTQVPTITVTGITINKWSVIFF